LVAFGSARPAERFSATIRYVRIVACVALLVGALAGCALNDEARYEDALRDAMPKGSDVVGECTGSTGLVEPVDRSCVFAVRGSRNDIAAKVAERLRRQDYRVGCSVRGDAVELSARGEEVAIELAILADGWIEPSQLTSVWSQPDRPPRAEAIPARHVAIDAYAFAAGTARANGLGRTNRGKCGPRSLGPEGRSECAKAWSAPANASHRMFVRDQKLVFGSTNNGPLGNVRVSLLPANVPRCVFTFLVQIGADSADLAVVGVWREQSVLWKRSRIRDSEFGGSFWEPNGVLRPNGTIVPLPRRG
jgi:hypothetical protein